MRETPKSTTSPAKLLLQFEQPAQNQTQAAMKTERRQENGDATARS
jgi:hypothetical protein